MPRRTRPLSRRPHARLLRAGLLALLLLRPGIPTAAAAAPGGRGPAQDSAVASGAPVLRITLLGDAGHAHPGNDAPIRAAARAAREFPGAEMAVFLGDNIYPAGLPPPGHDDRRNSERILDAQLRLFRDDSTLGGLFVAGNHDWDGMGRDGLQSVVRQADYLRENSGGRIGLVPGDGGPGPAIVHRDSAVQVIALDSQWWLHSHVRPAGPAAVPDSAAMRQVADSLLRLLVGFEGPVSVVLAHHPLETHGPHGGYFPVTDHIFPLRHVVSWLWLPLPVIGSVYPILRAGGYSAQDATSDEYGRYIGMIGGAVREAASGGRATVIVASGHEHSLQVIEPADGLWYLVSGNGILDHSTPVSEGPKTLFASEEAGFMTLDVYGQGGVMLTVTGVRAEETGTIFGRWIPPPLRR